MNLIPNLMKHLHNYVNFLMRLLNIQIYVVYNRKYQRYGVFVNEWVHSGRRVGNYITLTIERTWMVCRFETWTMGGDIKSRNMEHQSHYGQFHFFPTNEWHTRHKRNIHKWHSIGNYNFEISQLVNLRVLKYFGNKMVG